MEPRPTVGQKHTIEVLVTPEMSAAKWGNTGVDVLATPFVIGMMEGCATLMLAPSLRPDQASVGTHVDIRHLSATPIGMLITVEAELIEVNGRRYTFNVEAKDKIETLAKGKHERYVLDSIDVFIERTLMKSSM